LASKERNRWNASLELFLTGGVGERLCKQLGFGLNLPPFSPEMVPAGITKIFRAGGLAKIDAARLRLTDLARIEKRSHFLSLFLDSRLDCVYFGRTPD
jgi:hypothetical protein